MSEWIGPEVAAIQREPALAQGLELRDLHTAVHSPLNLQLPECGVIGISGPSGSGKSALLAALAGLLPAAGEIYWRGDCWQKRGFSLPPHKRALCWGAQQPRLFPNLNVAQNLQLALRYQRRPLHSEWQKRLLRACALEPLLQRPVEQLSGGEAQRVALLRQLFTNAPLQLFDEPLSALDSALRIGSIIPALKTFWREHPALVLWVSHDRRELQLLADQFFQLRAGELQAGEDLLVQREQQLNSQRPLAVSCLHLRVRELVQEHQLLLLDLRGHTLYADRLYAGSGQYRPGEPVRALLAAADISVSVERPSASSLLNSVPAVLRQAAALQDGRMRLDLACGGQSLLAEISKYSYKQLQLQPGQALFAQFKAGSLQGL